MAASVAVGLSALYYIFCGLSRKRWHKICGGLWGGFGGFFNGDLHFSPNCDKMGLSHRNTPISRIVSPQHLRHHPQHILNKDPIPRRGVVDEHVGHCPHQLAVLNDGRAAHALHDAPCLLDQGGVRDG